MDREKLSRIPLPELRDRIIAADNADEVSDIKSMLEAREDRGAAEEELIALADAAISHLKGKKTQRRLSIVCFTLAAVIAAFVIYILASTNDQAEPEKTAGTAETQIVSEMKPAED